MLFDFYVFTRVGEAFDMYPLSVCKDFLKAYAAETAGEDEIRIHRQEELCYHIYTRQIQATADAPVIGLCLVFNNAYFSEDYSRMFGLFQQVHSWMSTWARFIQLENNGRLTFTFQKLSEKKTDISLIKQRLQNTIDRDFSESFQTLPIPTYSNEICHQEYGEYPVPLLETLLQHYDKIRITTCHQPTDPEMASTLLMRKTKDYETLAAKYKQLQKEKTQETRVSWLSFLLFLCCIGGFYLWQRNKGDDAQIDSLTNRLSMSDSAVTRNRDTIISLRDSVFAIQEERDEYFVKLSSFASVSLQQGAFSTDNTSSDNGWIMWLYANCPIKLHSFKVRPANSHDFTLSLYNAADELIATQSVSTEGGSWQTVDVSSSGWILQSGYYYIRISSPNGNSLCWHSSNDEEFSRYSCDPLHITGCCPYNERDRNNAKHRHSYYQYFYDFRYSLYAGN